MSQAFLSDKIRNLADSLGIDVLRFADAGEFSNYALSSSPRRNPKLSLPDAKSIIVAGIYIGGLTIKAWSNSLYGRTSRLFLSGFFLDVVKPLEPIVELLKKSGYKAIACDSSTSNGSILPLKLAAVRAGIGWQGKHSLLISKKYGTFLALGGIITNAGLEHNNMKESDHCGKCSNCQQACPLKSLNKPYVLDRNLCLSNLLQSSDLPENAKAIMENRAADCEICQEACPWNKKHLAHPLATPLAETFQNKIKDWEALFYLPNLVKLTEKGYMEEMGHLKTCIPYDIFHRNVLIAMEYAKNKEMADK